MERLMRRLNGSLSRSVRRSVQDIFQQSPLDLRFALQKTLDPRVTFTRASSGTYVGSDGVLQTAANDVPRFDHNPTTGESLGLLVEEQRTNSLVQSENLGTTWTFSSASASTNTATAPDSQTSADTLIPSNGIANGLCRQDVSGLLDSTTYTLSVFLKSAGLNTASLQFYNKANTFHGTRIIDLTNGTLSGSDFVGVSSVVAYPNGWYRLIFTGLGSGTGVTTPNIRIICTATGNGTSGIYVWGAQLEAGAFPTSYIPTTTATATRSADVASITGTNFSSWYRQDAQTWFAEYAPVYNASATVPASTSHLMQVYNLAVGTNNYAIRGANNSVNQEFVARNPTAGAQFPNNSGIGFGVAGTNRKVSFGIDSSTLNISTNGTINSVANNAAALMATHDILSIGGGTGGSPPYALNGTIRRLTYWPARLPNSTLQQITA